ncbi:SAM-dependent methyltransferase [Sinomonas sp.]|uniref:SAM-dependent methyltransferase n=1 Tax=Sinomonas sp. TaxID=1914986 RepID=UPI003F7F5F97
MDTADTPRPSEFWDQFYSERHRVWSGKPNASLVREISMVAPGRALDLGCGEGADALWLAARGWTVTAVDISAVALDRAAQHAEEAGVAQRITWLRRDLTEWTPEGEFDLISAEFLHSPIELPRELILRRASEAVAPGGLLFVVGHVAFPPWSRHGHDEAEQAQLPTAEELAVSLGLRADAWEVETSTSDGREVTGPEGQIAIMTDAVLKARRR